MPASFEDIKNAVDTKDLFYNRNNMSQLLYPIGYSNITFRDSFNHEDVITFDENTFNTTMRDQYFKSDRKRGPFNSSRSALD